MAEDVLDDAEFSISGAWGELYYVDPLGKRAPRRIWEVSTFSARQELTKTAVALAGNEQGNKNGAVTRTGSLTVRLIDAFLENIAEDEMPSGVEARRAARDAGRRRSRGFTFHVWLDDPDALGKLGYEITGVTFNANEIAFDLSQVVMNREYAFEWKSRRRLSHFERVGNEISPTTGLPAIAYKTPDNG